MLGYARSRALLWCASLAGAVLFASAIAALAVPGTPPGSVRHLQSLLRILPETAMFAPGDSVIADAPALAAAAPELEITLRLILGSIPIALLLGCAAALILAGRRLGPIAGSLLQVAGSVPLFCGALFFAILLDLLVPPAGDGVANPELFLASLIGIAGAGAVTRAMTRSLAGISREEFSRLARFGLRNSQILRRHVLRQGLGAALTQAILRSRSLPPAPSWNGYSSGQVRAPVSSARLPSATGMSSPS
jgi:ABC-type dipeptide/oligopeptide/nickel transport system permease component